MITTITRHSLTVTVPDEYGDNTRYSLPSADPSHHQSRPFYYSQPVVFNGGNRRRSKASVLSPNPTTRPQSDTLLGRSSPKYTGTESSWDTASRRRYTTYDCTNGTATYCHMPFTSSRPPLWRSMSASTSPTPDYRRPSPASVRNDTQNSDDNHAGSVVISLSATVNWIEQLLRRCVVRFRSRRRRRRRCSSCSKSFQSATSSREVIVTARSDTVKSSINGGRQSTLEAQIMKQYAVYQSVQLPVIERLFALFYCWYFSRIDHVNGLLTTAAIKISIIVGRRSHRSTFWRSFRLALAVSLVTFVDFIGAVSFIVLLKALLVGLTFLMHSALNFVFLLSGLFLFSIAMATFTSFK